MADRRTSEPPKSCEPISGKTFLSVSLALCPIVSVSLESSNTWCFKEKVMVRGSRHPEHLESVLTLCVTLGPSFYLSESKLSREDPLRGQ